MPRRSERRRHKPRRGARFRSFRGKILIVTEDTKSSVGYFEEIRVEHRIPEQNVRVIPGSGSDPDRVVRTAEALLREESRAGTRAVDRVFVVIDRDSHATYDPAITLLRQLNEAAASGGTQRVKGWKPPDDKPERERFELVLSDPCFELWLLLHFTPWNSPFSASGSNSICGSVANELKKSGRLPDYDKGKRGWWAKTKYKYKSEGKPNAFAANEASAQAERTNPSTTVYEVVEAILEIGRQQ